MSASGSIMHLFWKRSLRRQMLSSAFRDSGIFRTSLQAEPFDALPARMTQTDKCASPLRFGLSMNFPRDLEIYVLPMIHGIDSLNSNSGISFNLWRVKVPSRQASVAVSHRESIYAATMQHKPKLSTGMGTSHSRHRAVPPGMAVVNFSSISRPRASGSPEHTAFSSQGWVPGLHRTPLNRREGSSLPGLLSRRGVQPDQYCVRSGH